MAAFWPLTSPPLVNCWPLCVQPPDWVEIRVVAPPCSPSVTTTVLGTNGGGAGTRGVDSLAHPTSTAEMIAERTSQQAGAIRWF